MILSSGNPGLVTVRVSDPIQCSLENPAQSTGAKRSINNIQNYIHLWFQILSVRPVCVSSLHYSYSFPPDVKRQRINHATHRYVLERRVCDSTALDRHEPALTLTDRSLQLCVCVCV